MRPDFAGQQTVLGQHFLKLDGSYGEEFTPIAQWVYNYVYDASHPINFGWNMKKIQAVSCNCGFNFIALVHWESGSKMQSFRRRDGATARIGWSRTLLPSLFAGSKRRGALTIGALHKRLSHGPLGEMTVGAKSIRTTNAKKFLLISILAI